MYCPGVLTSFIIPNSKYRVEQFIFKLDRQCTHDVIYRHIRATILSWKSNIYYIFWVCICSLSYPACKAQAPHYIVIACPAVPHFSTQSYKWHDICEKKLFNPLKPELNPICYLLALLGAHHFLHVSRIRVKLLTFRRLKSYIYGAPILDVSRSHTTTQHSR